MIEVSMVPTQYIDTCWDKAKPHLERALEYAAGTYTIEDVYDCIVDCGYNLWVTIKDQEIIGAVVTRIANYPQKKALTMVFCGGDEFASWKDPMIDLLRRFAADSGCECLEATARPGWAKIFKDDGYTQRWVSFELPLARKGQ